MLKVYIQLKYQNTIFTGGPILFTPLYSSPSFSKDVAKVKFRKWPLSVHAFLLCTKRIKKSSFPSSLLFLAGFWWCSPLSPLSQIFYSDCIATTSSFTQPNVQQIWLTVSVLHNRWIERGRTCTFLMQPHQSFCHEVTPRSSGPRRDLPPRWPSILAKICKSWALCGDSQRSIKNRTGQWEESLHWPQRERESSQIDTWPAGNNQGDSITLQY